MASSLVDDSHPERNRTRSVSAPKIEPVSQAAEKAQSCMRYRGRAALQFERCASAQELNRLGK
jgi:hypothetical protein